MTPGTSTTNAATRPTAPLTYRPILALAAVAILGLVVVSGGVAAAQGKGTKTGSTSTTTRRHAASAKATKAQPVLEAGVLYRAAGSEYGGFGDGEVRPRSISTSGVGATNGVVRIVWTSWGGQTATGRGTGCVLKSTGIDANCRATPARVVAYELQRCAGKPAYLAVTWYFPSLGQKLSEKGTVPNPSCAASQQATTTTSPPATSSPPTSSTPSSTTATSTPAPVTGSSASCTTASITAASRAVTSNFYGVTGFGCSGNFAYAFVTVTGTDGQPIAEVTQVFEATGGSWHVVSRALCTNGTIPAAIYQQACQTN